MTAAQTSKATRHPLDFHPTPQWHTKALLKHLPWAENLAEGQKIILEPFVGDGAIAEVFARETPHKIVANDICDYGYPLDYSFDLSVPKQRLLLPACDWIVTNPPYDLINDPLVVRDLWECCKDGMALLLRQTWFTAGTGKSGTNARAEWLRGNPPVMRLTLPRYPFSNNSKTGKPQVDACAHEWVVWHKQGWRPENPFPVETSKSLDGWEWRYE